MLNGGFLVVFFGFIIGISVRIFSDGVVRVIVFWEFEFERW